MGFPPLLFRIATRNLRLNGARVEANLSLASSGSVYSNRNIDFASRLLLGLIMIDAFIQSKNGERI
jgi:hypothetical protein